MLPAVRDDITVQGNLDGHKIAMSFDQASISHIMSILTDLYSDPEMAVIRELSTNAWDSHVEAGIKRPIEITTPTQLSQFFVVKDYGVGMNSDDIENVYSLYGASTKRATNDLTGTLGLGCKSPLTYSTSFTVTAIKNRVKTQVAVSREADGSGVMEIVDTSETTEENGVEIIIPAKVNNQFETKCAKFFKFWPDGSVLVNKQKPKRFEGTVVTPKITLSDMDKNYVVMGNVAYPVDPYKVEFRGYKFVAYVDMGSVNFTPSREQLQYTAQTNKTLNDLRIEIESKMKQKMADDITNASSYGDAYKRYYDWAKVWSHNLNITSFQYKGVNLPGVFNHTRFDTTANSNVTAYATIYNPHAYRYTTNTGSRFDYKTLESGMLVYNFKIANLSSTHKQKLKQYAADNKLNPSKFILSDSKIGLPWTSDIPMVNWDDIAAIKLPGKNNVGNGTKVVNPDPYDILEKTGYLKSVATLDATKPIYYFSPADHKDLRTCLPIVFEDATIVSINKNRWAKFLRDFPTAMHITEAWKEWLKQIDKTFSEADRFSFSLDWRHDHFKKLDAAKIDDPQLKQKIIWANGGVKTDKTPLFNAARQISSHYGFAAMNLPEVPDPMKNYTLVDLYHGGEDNYIYINAKYAAMQSKNGVVKV